MPVSGLTSHGDGAMNSDVIISVHNRHVAFLRSLHRTRSRREARAFHVEGLRLAGEALQAGPEPLVVLFDPSALESTELGQNTLSMLESVPRAFAASPEVIEAAAETRTPAGLVMAMPEPDPVDLSAVEGLTLLLVLDGISDAGNVGTILRSASAVGLTHVVLSGHGADPYSGKVVRAGMGAHFRLKILQTQWPDLLPRLAGYRQIIGTVPRGGQTIYEVDWSQQTALLVGSEAHGLSPDASEAATGFAHIPMVPGVESLNAAVVASIALFHAQRAMLG